MMSNEIYTGKGLIEQMNEIHIFSTEVNKKSLKEFLINVVSDDEYEMLWKRTFGETFEEFVNRILEL